MKKSLFVAAFAALAVVSCKKTDVVTSTDGSDTIKTPMETPISPVTPDSPAVKMGDSPAVKIQADKVEIVTPAPTTTTTKTEVVAPAK